MQIIISIIDSPLSFWFSFFLSISTSSVATQVPYLTQSTRNRPLATLLYLTLSYCTSLQGVYIYGVGAGEKRRVVDGWSDGAWMWRGDVLAVEIYGLGF